ncbi:MAG: 2-oxoacid:acceptor oxidoreductase subunit alpha [Nitrososphaerota archaeon]|nr:2-oxoacid:acceptor oxidoreductase subunit alpha [Nitrososphaerota archaeon]
MPHQGKEGELTIRIGAAAGDGIQSAGEMIMRVLSRSGLWITTYNGNQSLIRGGHVWFHVHAAAWKTYSMGYGLDFLIPLTQLAYDQHYERLNSGGAVIYDPSSVKAHDLPAGVRDLSVPLGEVALRHDRRPIMRNTVALGALCAAVGVDFDVLAKVIADQFGRKDRSVSENNVKAAQEGYDVVRQGAPPIRQLKYDYSSPKPVMTAGYAISMGAVNAGCRFYSAYPMSPASPIVHWMAAHARKLGLTVFLAEDEISVMNATVGAAYAGARAMCATSGGGFSLMQEAVGEAAMTETPVVVVDVMRAGPSTGLPTKTSQGDLNMMLGISHDDFPRVILAPRNAEESFYTAERAFNLAETYQVPVIVLLDYAIGDGGYSTVENLDFDFRIDRGKMLSAPGPGDHNGFWFRRFALTSDNVSPRAVPGTPGMMFVAKTDEHDEWGHDMSDVLAGLNESAPLRERMQEKRMKKLEAIKGEMKAPELFGPSGADITVITWGSSANPSREAIRELHRKGVSVNALEFSDIFPLNEVEVTRILRTARTKVDVEVNYTGQFAKLLARDTGVEMDSYLLKYDGEPIYPIEVEKHVLSLRKEVHAVA